MRVLAVVSGGMDSAAMLYALRQDSHGVEAVSFDYGQRHRKELVHAEGLCRSLGVPHDVVDLSPLQALLRSALTHGEAVPDGHYAEASMRATVVPNRNAIMLNIAAGIAVSRGMGAIATGVHAGDHFIYPDCRPEFIAVLERCIRVANEGFAVEDFRVLTPWLAYTKADIVRFGVALGVPFERTWSCYKGERIHCGLCGTCYERHEAFKQAAVEDPTTYAATPEALAG